MVLLWVHMVLGPFLRNLLKEILKGSHAGMTQTLPSGTGLQNSWENHHFLMGQLTVNGNFSTVMLDYQKVVHS